MMDCRESAIAIGEAENNYFHGNIMTNCSFYFPLEPLTVRYNVISRSNKVGGKDVVFFYGVVVSSDLHYDLSDVGQLIIISSSGLTLSNMSANGGSQAIVLKDCKELSLVNITVSNHSFHTMMAYECRQISLSNCTMSDCAAGIEALFSDDLVLSDIVIERTNTPILMRDSGTVMLDGGLLLSNEFGIHLDHIEAAYLFNVQSYGCGAQNILSRFSNVALVGCRIISDQTCLDVEGRSVTVQGCYLEGMGDNTLIKGSDSVSLQLSKNTFKAKGPVKNDYLHPFDLQLLSSLQMEGNELTNFGLLPAHLKFFEHGSATGNTVNGKPLLILSGAGPQDKVLTGQFGQLVLDRVSDIVIEGISLARASAGIIIVHSFNITVFNTSISDCIWGGYMLDSHSITFRSCDLSSNRYGLHFDHSFGWPGPLNLIESCTFETNQIGCYLRSGNIFRVSNCSFFNNSISGLSIVVFVSMTNIQSNLFMDNAGPGILLESSTEKNYIYRNAFIRNNRAGPTFSDEHIQCSDRGSNNWSYGQGNFWYDMKGPDVDGDLIVDTPYKLSGGDNSDPLPMVRIPSSILPPPDDVKVIPEGERSHINWKLPATSRFPLKGFRLYLNRTLLWEGAPDTRETWLSLRDLPYGNISMTTLCEFGESEPSMPIPSRNETEPPTIRWLNSERRELSSIRDKLRFMVQDRSGILEASCSMDGVQILSENDILEDIFTVPLNGLKEGPHKVTVRARDLLRNGASMTFDIVIDDSPTLIMLGLPGNNTLFNTRTLKVQYEVADTVGTVDRVEMRQDGKNVILTGSVGTFLLSDLSEGEHILELLGTDMAGNLGRKTTEFKIDLTPPKVLSYQPQGGSVEGNTSITIELSEPLERDVSLTLNGMNRSFETSGTIMRTAMLSLEPSRDHLVRVSGMDEAGNTMSFEWMFKTVPSPSSPATVRGRTVDKDGGPLMDSGVWLGGDLLSSTGTDGSFEIRLLEGNHTLRIERSGFRTRTIELSVGQGEERDLGDIVLERNESEEDDRGPWLLFLTGLVFLAVMLLTVVVLISRRKGGTGHDEE
jgi:nitrous oxidase accessory protein NosD